ncbi:hypothetical protein ACQR3P_28940 [Rhodococcus sp. IEGM1300]
MSQARTPRVQSKPRVAVEPVVNPEEEVFELIAGCDGGNTKTKISYLSDEGHIVDLAIPTVIASASPSTFDLGTMLYDGEMAPTENLHVMVQSDALTLDKSSAFFYVGSSAYAQTESEPVEPNGEEKHDSHLHLIVTLVGLALATAESGETSARINYRGGLPINEYKRYSQQLIKQLKGVHHVKFIDGKHKDVTIELDIYDGKILAEGVSSVYGLIFNIEDNVIQHTPLYDQIREDGSFILADLGAETLDVAFYTRGGVSKQLSKSFDLGTNRFMDELIEEISALSDFETITSKRPDARISRTREEFIGRYLEKVTIERIKTGKDISYLATWGRVKGVDVTELIIEKIASYGNEVINLLDDYWSDNASDAERLYLVGGGALFGYEALVQAEGYEFLPNDVLFSSPFVTARSYLVSNILSQQSEEVQS